MTASGVATAAGRGGCPQRRVQRVGVPRTAPRRPGRSVGPNGSAALTSPRTPAGLGFRPRDAGMNVRLAYSEANAPIQPLANLWRQLSAFPTPPALGSCLQSSASRACRNGPPPAGSIVEAAHLSTRLEVGTLSTALRIEPEGRGHSPSRNSTRTMTLTGRPLSSTPVNSYSALPPAAARGIGTRSTPCGSSRPRTGSSPDKR